MLKGRNLYKGGCGLSPISCGAVLLEQGCVSLGVRVSSVTRFQRVGFEDCAFH